MVQRCQGVWLISHQSGEDVFVHYSAINSHGPKVFKRDRLQVQRRREPKDGRRLHPTSLARITTLVHSKVGIKACKRAGPSHTCHRL